MANTRMVRLQALQLDLIDLCGLYQKKLEAPEVYWLYYSGFTAHIQTLFSIPTLYNHIPKRDLENLLISGNRKVSIIRYLFF